jgi:uncharacterized membrane protein
MRHNDGLLRSGRRSLFAHAPTWFILILSLAGLNVSGLLSMSHLSGVSISCGGRIGCDQISQHASAFVFGIPIAVFGVGAYLVLSVITAARIIRYDLLRRCLYITSYLLCGAGVAVSIGLTAYSVRFLGISCIWCLASAGFMTLIFVCHGLTPRTSVRISIGDTTVSSHRRSAIGVFALAAGALFGLPLMWQHVTNAAKVAAPYDKLALARMPLENLVPKDSHHMGAPGASKVIILFGDLQCAACHTAMAVLQEVVAEEDVCLVFRHFPLSGHAGSFELAVLVEVASEKSSFWGIVGELHMQKDWRPGAFGERLALSQDDLKRINDPNDKARRRVVRDMRTAKELGLKLAPSFFVLEEHARTGVSLSELQAGIRKRTRGSSQHLFHDSSNPRSIIGWFAP